MSDTALAPDAAVSRALAAATPLPAVLQSGGLGVDPLILRLGVAVVALAVLITVGRFLLDVAWKLVILAGAVVAVLFVVSLLLG